MSICFSLKNWNEFDRLSLVNSMLSININEFRNIEKFDTNDNCFWKTKFKNEYNSKSEINIIEIKVNRRLMFVINDYDRNWFLLKINSSKNNELILNNRNLKSTKKVWNKVISWLNCRIVRQKATRFNSYSIEYNENE